MTQVWMVRNSDTDIHLFNRFDHLLPSVEISYSACKKVEISFSRQPSKVTFVVKGFRSDTPFEETIVADCYPVWTEPSHL